MMQVISQKSGLKVILFLTMLLCGFLGSAYGQEIKAKGVFETRVLDFPKEKGQEIARQRALANAAKETGKYVEVNERLLQTDKGTSISKDIAVFSSAILSEKVVEYRTQHLGDRVRFEAEVLVEFEDKQSALFEQYLNAMQHKTSLMLELSHKMDELEASQIKLEQMVGSFNSEQVQNEIQTINRLSKSIEVGFNEARTIISPLAKASLKSQMELIEQIKAKEAQRIIIEAKQEELDKQRRFYIENMQAVGKSRLHDMLVSSTRTEVSQIKIQPIEKNYYNLKITLQLITDAIDVDAVCRLVESFYLGQNCQVKQTPEFLTFVFDTSSPISFPEYYLYWRIIYDRKLSAIELDNTGKKVSLRLKKGKQVTVNEIDDWTYRALKHDPNLLKIDLE